MAELEYQVLRSRRRTIAIQIQPDGQVLVRCPLGMDLRRVRSFVESKRSWIEKQLLSRPPVTEKLSDRELAELTGQARALVVQRAAHFAPLVGVGYGRISIRKQKTRWGSCSSKGNLNFNCLLVLVPEQVLDYIVVHELCHRKEMNHSHRFWAEVAKVLPEYDGCRKWLKKNGAGLIARLP